MGEHVFSGTPASPGVAAGTAFVLDAVSVGLEAMPVASRPAESARAQAALNAAAAELDALAAGLPPDEAELVATGSLMAADPTLRARVIALCTQDGLPAAAAIVAACGEAAAQLAAIPDETLAARADDVRSLGRRAARLASPQ